MVGTRLKILRYMNDYTIWQLCEMINMNSNTYVKYERDESDINTETLNKFADFYNVSADYFLGKGNCGSEIIKRFKRKFDIPDNE